MTRGEIMREHRLRVGLTQKALAERSGVSRVALNRLENGTHQGGIVTIELLADTLGISIDEYIGHEVKTDG